MARSADGKSLKSFMRYPNGAIPTARQFPLSTGIFFEAPGRRKVKLLPFLMNLKPLRLQTKFCGNNMNFKSILPFLLLALAPGLLPAQNFWREFANMHSYLYNTYSIIVGNNGFI